MGIVDLLRFVFSEDPEIEIPVCDDEDACELPTQDFIKTTHGFNESHLYEENEENDNLRKLKELVEVLPAEPTGDLK